MGQEVYCSEFFLLSLLPEPTGKPSSLGMVETLHGRGHVAAADLKAKREREDLEQSQVQHIAS